MLAGTARNEGERHFDVEILRKLEVVTQLNISVMQCTKTAT